MVLVQRLAKSLYNHPEGQMGREQTVTNDSVVEVVGQHPLTHSHQQPEGFLLLSIQQQNGGQDVHGLLRGFTGEQTITDQVMCTTETFNNTQGQVIHRNPDYTEERCSIPSQSRLSWNDQLSTWASQDPLG